MKRSRWSIHGLSVTALKPAKRGNQAEAFKASISAVFESNDDAGFRLENRSFDKRRLIAHQIFGF